MTTRRQNSIRDVLPSAGSCLFPQVDRPSRRFRFPFNPVKALAPLLSFVLGGVSAFWLAGCAGSYQVKVDALSKPEAEKAVAYRLQTSGAGIDPKSLRNQEAERFVRTALSGRGLYEAPKPELAEVVVNLDYGVSEPKLVREMRTEPIYRTLPGRVFTAVVQVGVDKNGNPIFATQTYQEPPSTEYIGDREYMVTVVKYEKYLRISARENKPAGDNAPPAELWTVDVSSEGESRDLRKHLPVLAAATIDFVGKDTRGQKSIRLKEEKEGAVAFVKKGMDPAPTTTPEGTADPATTSAPEGTTPVPPAPSPKG